MSVYDSAADKVANLVSLGAREAGGLPKGASQCDIVITSLPGPAQVRDVMFGEMGLIAALRPGTTIIDTSTIAPDLARELAEKTRPRGIEFLEAPITNAVDAAAAGRLSIFVGGDEAVFKKNMPIFEILGTKVFFAGPAGNGATLKLLTNLLWFVSAAAIGEGLMLGAKAGVPLNIVWEAIKASAGASWVAEHDVPSIFAGHYDPSFSLALCCKDLGLVNEIARAQGYELQMGNFVEALFMQARERYGDSAAELHVVKLVEEQAGLLLRPPHGQPLSID